MLKNVSIAVVHLAAEHIEGIGPGEFYASRPKRESKVWAADRWSVTLTYEGRTFTTSYSTGIGHRRPSNTHGAGFYCGPETAKKKINAKSVLDCLFSDAQSGLDTFESWCSEMGVDTDSRKALDTYLTCQKTAVALRKLFGADYAAIELEVRDDS